jgi:SpoVK/Ycf46/Vps4 family AAA+-type ATPase
VYFKYANIEKDEEFTFYLIGPAKLIQHINNKLTTVEFVKQIDKGVCYGIISAEPQKFMSKKPLLVQTKLQKQIINKIKNYARNVFPILHKNNLPTVYSILLHGPPGTGKTTICNTIASELSAGIIYFNINELNEIYKVIKKNCWSKTAIRIIAINELDLYYKNDTILATGQSSGFIDNIHDILENSGSYSSNNFVIVICTTNNYKYIESQDPATISRFKEVIKMPELSINEAKEFAREYANVVLENKAHLLDGKIEQMKPCSIREITKFITAEATSIISADYECKK